MTIERELIQRLRLALADAIDCMDELAGGTVPITDESWGLEETFKVLEDADNYLEKHFDNEII